MKWTNFDEKGSTECIFSYIIIWGRQSPYKMGWLSKQCDDASSVGKFE